MTKWSEEFIGTFEDTAKVKRMTEQMARVNKEEVARINEMMSRFKK